MRSLSSINGDHCKGTTLLQRPRAQGTQSVDTNTLSEHLPCSIYGRLISASAQHDPRNRVPFILMARVHLVRHLLFMLPNTRHV